MTGEFNISPYFEIVKPTIVNGFDYTALHWADKQKPLREVAGELAMFPELHSPPLVPEEIDEETAPSIEEVTVDVVISEEVTVETTMVERVTVSEHYLAVEYIPVRQPERRTKPRELVA
jgi:hypothetical protein